MPRKSPASAKPRRRQKENRAAGGALVYVTRQVHFNSSHRLHQPDRDETWNAAQFGLCNNVHGHNYVLEVTVRGVPDPTTGYVIDLGELKRLMNEAVADKCDHRDLNSGVDFLRGILPSTENLAVAFWRELAPLIRNGELHCVRLYETPRNFVEYFGETLRGAGRR